MVSRSVLACAACACLTLAAAVSCSRENSMRESDVPVRVSANGREYSVTKGMLQNDNTRELEPFQVDGIGMFNVTETEALGWDCPLAQEQTKGSIVGNLNAAGNAFTLYAWMESTRGWWKEPNPPALFIENETITRNGGSWNFANTYYWRLDVKTNFWGFYPQSLAANEGSIAYDLPASEASNDEQKCVRFSYSMPQPSNPCDWHDATRMQDILVAYTQDWWSEKFSTSSEIDLEFSHALSAVSFNVDGVTAAGIRIIGMSILGMYSKGDCTVTGGESNDISFAWSNLSTVADYCQNTTDENACFLVIPQTLPSGARLGLTIERSEGTVQQLEVPLSANWQTGHHYTYLINYSTEDVLSVDVSDAVNAKVQNNVKISNNGNIKEYVRAAIVGFWCNDNGIVVAGWDPSDATQGSFSGLAGSGWVKGTDGFYYYDSAVEAGKETAAKLYNSYTAATAPVPGAHLELNVAVQAVKYDSEKANVTAAWGSEAATYIK